MARPPRLVLPGGTYHLIARGNRRANIVEDDVDRAIFFGMVAEVFSRRAWRCTGYCLMTNHYHFLVETPGADLSAGMHSLNGRYARAFNRRHGWSGHLFEKRFSAILAESDWHLLELCRYIVLNPVRAGLCRHASQWPWSSFRACSGNTEPPPFLDVPHLLSLFGRDPAKARMAFRAFVENASPDARAA